MKPVLIDTGCIVALLDRSERNHEQCVEAVARTEVPLLTCEAVIAESCYLLRKLKGAPEAVLKNVSEGQILVPFRLADGSSRVAALLEKSSHVPMDLGMPVSSRWQKNTIPVPS